MIGLKKTRYKVGNINVFVPLGIAFLAIIFAGMFLGYFQINMVTAALRKNLYFLANNAIVAMDNQELSYGVYSIDLEKAKNIIQDLLNKTYKDNTFIKEIKVTNISFKEQEIPKLSLEVEVKFIPVIKAQGKEQYKFTMKEEVKMSLMTYNKGSKINE